MRVIVQVVVGGVWSGWLPIGIELDHSAQVPELLEGCHRDLLLEGRVVVVGAMLEDWNRVPVDWRGMASLSSLATFLRASARVLFLFFFRHGSFKR